MTLKQKLILPAILIAIFLIASIKLIANYYSSDLKQNELLDLSKANSYDSTLFITLPKLIKKVALSKNVRGYVESIDFINGDDNSINTLKNELNMALSEYEKWTVKVDAKTESGMLASRKKKLAKFKDLYVGRVFSNLQRQAKNQANYSIQAYYKKTDLRKNEVVNDVKITLEIADVRNEVIVFTVISEFMHPQTVQNLKNANRKIQKLNQKNKDERVDSKNKADFAKKLIVVITIIFIVYIVALFFGNFLTYFKKRKRKEEILKDIEKREDLVANGHYVAAFELVDEYLSIFPNDVDIKAFKERLLDYTNNDPKKSQIAFVKIAKLKDMVSRGATDPTSLLLSPAEQNELLELSIYNPDLKLVHNQVLAIEDKRDKENALLPKIQALEKLFNSGKLDSAKKEVSSLQTEYPHNTTLDEISQKIIDQKELAEDNFLTVQSLLKKGKITETLLSLKDILKKYSEHQEAVKLLDSLTINKNKKRYILENENGIKFTIFCGNHALLGRADDDYNPDILLTNRHVSRKHLDINFLAEKIEVKDNGSTGGTYVNGEKIDVSTLKDRDDLNIAKVLDFSAKVHKEYGPSPDGLLLYNNKELMAIVNKAIRFGIIDNKVKHNNEDVALFYGESILLFVVNDTLFIPKVGDAINFGTSIYSIKEIS